MKTALKLFALLALVALGAQPVRAALKFYEGFNYPTGQLHLASTGVWEITSANDSNYFNVVETGLPLGDSLMYSKDGVPLVVNGRCARLHQVTGGSDGGQNMRLTHDLDGNPVSFSEGIVWAGWLHSDTSGASYWNGDRSVMLRESGKDNDWSQSRVKFGYRNQAAPAYWTPDAWLTKNANQGENSFEFDSGYQRPAQGNVASAEFFVVKIDHVASNVTFFINPKPGNSDPAATADLVTNIPFQINASGNMTFDQLKLWTAWSAGLNEVLYFDEIRVGDTYRDVAPVPEPAAALAAVFALLFAARRIHR